MSPKTLFICTLLASISPACLEAEIEFVGVTNDSKETKIAHEQGIILADLEVLNPGVSWTKLKVGMKIRIK